jgi:small-conductance mechanosensitive channel
MSKSWAKEDRHCWEKSEVMRELEKTVISNFSKLEKLSQQKLDLKGIKTDLEGATKAAKEFNKALTGSDADDGLVQEPAREEALDHQCDSADCPKCSEKKKALETLTAKKEILEELRKMADKAISEKRIILAYRIERTIAEVEDDS